MLVYAGLNPFDSKIHEFVGVHGWLVRTMASLSSDLGFVSHHPAMCRNIKRTCRFILPVCTSSNGYRVEWKIMNCEGLKLSVYFYDVCTLLFMGDKLSMLTHTYQHNPLRRLSGHLQSLDWQSTLRVAQCLIWWFASTEKSMVIHGTECPYLDQASSSNTKIVTSVESASMQVV